MILKNYNSPLIIIMEFYIDEISTLKPKPSF